MRFLRVDGSGLRYLDPTQIETLSLYRVPLTDEGMLNLKAFQNLRNLEIHGGDITTNGMKSLAELRKLELVVLTNVKLGDEGLGYLPRSVRQLALREVPVTNAALDRLTDLNLERLELASTQVTAAGIDRLRKRLPGCQCKTSPDVGGDGSGSGIEIENLFRAHPR